MFEFGTSYKDPDWHKEEDRPFIFPPEGVGPKIDANLIEIYGKNGSGKTTLLNVLALALGYLDRGKDLDNKPALKRKLLFFHENKSLEYRFRICCDKPKPVELRIERVKGKRQIIYLNSKQVDPDAISKEFDVVFLTEDDPKKVITVSKGKLTTYFDDLQRRLGDLDKGISKHIIEIDEYSSFKKEEQRLVDDIDAQKKRENELRDETENLKGMLEKVNQRIATQRKMDLLTNRDQIEREHKKLLEQYEKLGRKQDKDILREINKLRASLGGLTDQRKAIDSDIVTTCQSLANHNMQLDYHKLLDGDYTEFNQLMRNLQEEKKPERFKLEIVDDMIFLLQRHPGDEIVPIVDRTVREVLSELYKIKVELSQDRVLALLTALDRHLEGRRNINGKIEGTEEKIAKMKQQITDLKNLEGIEKQFQESARKYQDLQKALKEDGDKIRQDYRDVAYVKGEPNEIEGKLHALEVDVRATEQLKSRLDEKLSLHRQKSTRRPLYEDKRRELEKLLTTTSRLKEMLNFWVGILRDTFEMKRSLPSLEKTSPIATPETYERFVKSVGEFLGAQFEPVLFDGKFHNVMHYDVERETFITEDQRRIPIDNLSQGQSKITALTGSLKEMNPDKKGIVLIDEIAELDPISLNKVKNDLKAKCDEGSIMLALLVRPTYDAGQTVEIKGWG